MQGQPLTHPTTLFWKQLLFVSALSLYLVGCLFIFEISSAEAIDAFRPDKAHTIVTKQLLYGFLGMILSLGIYRIGVERILRAAPYLLWIQVILLLLVFLPGIGLHRNGSSRWFALGPFLLQPSEFAKITLALYALWATKEQGYQVAWSFWLKVGLVLGLIVIEPDNRTAAITSSVLVATFFFSPIKLQRFILPCLILATLSGSIAMQFPYVQRRLQVYFNPQSDPMGRGYQPMQAKTAVGSGGMWGRGIGQSLQKFSYLPEAQNDYIAAIIAEESGFWGAMTLLTLYALLLMAMFALSLDQKELHYARLMSVLSYLFVAQVVINLCVVVGLFPSTGLNLPLVSQGGSSLWANMIILTLFLSCSEVRRRAPPLSTLATPIGQDLRGEENFLFLK